MDRWWSHLHPYQCCWCGCCYHRRRRIKRKRARKVERATRWRKEKRTNHAQHSSSKSFKQILRVFEYYYCLILQTKFDVVPNVWHTGYLLSVVFFHCLHIQLSSCGRFVNKNDCATIEFFMLLGRRVVALSRPRLKIAAAVAVVIQVQARVE